MCLTFFIYLYFFGPGLQVPERPEGGNVSPRHKGQTGERVGQQRVPLQTGETCPSSLCVSRVSAADWQLGSVLCFRAEQHRQPPSALITLSAPSEGVGLNFDN